MSCASRVRWAPLLLVCILSATSVAVASDPPSGSVSHATPEAKWTGSMISIGYIDLAYTVLGGTMGTCMAPHCDTYTLDVKDSDDLTIELSTEFADICGELTQPNGSTVFICGEAESKKNRKTIKKAAVGTYTLDIFGIAPPPYMQTYAGLATLGPPAALAPPFPAPTAPAPSPAVRLSARAKGASAKRVNKGRRLALTVSSSAPVTKFVAVLARGGQRYARGSLAKLDGRGKLALRLSRKLAKGRYSLSMSAVGGDGKAVNGRAKIAVGR